MKIYNHRFKKGHALTLIFLLIGLLFVHQAHAQNPLNDRGATPPEMLEVNLRALALQQGLSTYLVTIGGILGKLTPWLFTFAGIALFIYLILGGFSYLSSAGDPKKVESARGKITAALIGFIIVFVAFWIVQIAAYIFGIDSLKSLFGLPLSP